MTDHVPGRMPTSSGSPADVKPTLLQALLTFGGGLVLAAGSCAGFLATLNMNRESALNIAFALGFFASLLASLVGVGLIILRQIRVMRRKRAIAVGATSPGGPRTPGPSAPGAAPAAAGLVDSGPAWQPLVVSGVLLAAAVGSVVMLVAIDPNPIAVLFLVLAAACAVGSVVTLVIALVRYGRGR